MEFEATHRRPDPTWQAPRPDPVDSDRELPASAEVVVIGGGIVGASTAFFLARRGIPTILCEKGAIGAEQSSRNWGWVRKMGRDPRELPLIIESLRIWEGLDKAVEAETGFRRSGILYLCKTESDLAKYEQWLEHARPYQLDTRPIAGAELHRVLPGSAADWAGALYTESDGCAEPQKAAPAIAAAARRHGAKVFVDCAVRGIEREGGRVAAVVTERGRVTCRAVVLAGGAWSGIFCRNLGIRLPQLKVLGSVARVGAFDGGPTVAARGPGFGFRKRLDGGYTVAGGTTTIADIVPDSFRFLFDFLPVLRMEWRDLRLRFGRRFFDEARLPNTWPLDQVSPFERVRTLDPAPAHGSADSEKAALDRVFPVFRGKAVVQRWAGLIDATPDAVPVISPVEALPGLFLATGFSGHGFGIGPGAGRLAADLVTGAPPLVDPAPFRYSRFVDGTRPKPIAGI
jgi:glycine/D-amino acid oxidase-like deaminating enzyme